jgi:flagellar basal body-associated protein FliL
MADAEEKDNDDEAEVEETEAKSNGKSKLIKLVGGFAGLLVMAWIAATLAVPSKAKHPRFSTPFTVPMVLDPDTKIPVNLDENNKTRFLQMNFNLFVRSYDESYVSARQNDPNYEPFLKSRLIAIATSKKLDEVIGGEAAQHAFLEEVRDHIDPILFPVHVGDTKNPLAAHEESGLMPGSMMDRASFRGKFHDHVLKIDAPARTIAIDDGQPLEFTGTEDNLVIRTGSGEVLYLDVTDLDPEFIGELPVGVHGRINRVLAVELVVQ